MKCRNWRTEEPEDPEGPENPEEPESPESPESPEASGKGPSGPLRKIRNLRKIPSASSPARKYMLFAPKPQALRRFICPATAHLRTKCRTPLRFGPQNTPAPHHNPYPCVSLRNLRNIRNLRKNRKLRKLRPPSARITPIICNLTYYNLRHNTHILIINNKLFTLFLARFKIKPYLCIV